MRKFKEVAKNIPVREFDVVVAGGGTAGVVAAIASARMGAKTALIEAKGYPGGIVVEGGTVLHSFYNQWKDFPGVEKRQVVKGIAQEIIDRLAEKGGTTGHGEVFVGYDYDSACTAIDTEIYKLVAFEMMVEAGVDVFVNTLLVDVVKEDSHITGVIVESRSGRELFTASSFIDCTGYGDLAAFAGAEYTEPNDHPVVNSIGVANVSLEKYHQFLLDHDALSSYAEGKRSGKDGQIIRLQADRKKLPDELRKRAGKIGMSLVVTTVHDDYFMFVKLNYKMPLSPTNRDAVAKAELELRKRQQEAIEIIREFIPGCEKAFIARTSPSITIRRGRSIVCDYDIKHNEILEGKHFEDDIMSYGFHDYSPKFQIKNGGTYGIPYKALRVKGFDNLLVSGMMITSDHNAHMSTRNTVSCMGQGQGAGTAAALCASKGCSTRELPYSELRQALLENDVVLEN